MVRYVRDTTGRFSQRPHYKPEELDRECETIISQFLRDKYGKVEFPVSTDDLTLLIERDTEDFDPYTDLSIYGHDVEGVTEFRVGKKPNVKIAEALSNDERRENRLRTTLTHEYGHVRFHAYLWEMEPQVRTCFGSDRTPASRFASAMEFWRHRKTIGWSGRQAIAAAHC